MVGIGWRLCAVIGEDVELLGLIRLNSIRINYSLREIQKLKW